MRVNLTDQAMSHTVAAGIYVHSVAGLLPKKAVPTAEFIHRVNKVFVLILFSGHFGDVD